ncbi:G5 domain-containing protein [Neobacillus cucumis]|uniref:G5 domain-containing protein n=1 Tax=Neobacillus cucumis TaxID=1740721 RepID=UPI0028536DD7|nr:G5 domain-containing protein [Neobacillus cucumis]MDR4948756.1 G5 domain-containing protein [Neobacillus cucumis]
MKKNTQFLKLFIVLVFSTAFIFSTSHYGAKAYDKFVNLDGKYSNGTTIGSINISGKTDTEAASLLEKQYADWLKNTKFTLQYSEKSVPFDLNLFYLDKQTTIDSIKDGQSNAVYLSLDLMQLEDQISILFPEINSKEVDFTKLKTNLESAASKLQNGEQTFNLTNDYMLANVSDKDFVVSEAVLQLTQIPDGLQTLVGKNPEITIAQGANFSVLDFAKNLKITDSNLLSVLGTGIYQAVLPSNFTIEDRNISTALPNYAPLGYEARVSPYKNMDLIITNTNKTSYKLVLSLNNNQFKVSLKGEKLLYNYKITKEEEQSLKPKTIVQYSPLLKSGQTVVKMAGTDGLFVKVYREVYQGEQLLKTEFISEDYYAPDYRVEVHALTGTTQATSTTGTATNTTTTPSTETNTDESQTTSTSGATQQDSNVDDLWGKPNEQPK